MKYKNRLTTILAASLISLCMVLAFTACGDNSENPPTETAGSEAATEESETTAASTSFNISEGLTLTTNDDKDKAFLKGNGFVLTMPNTGTWSYKCDGDSNSIEIYYMPADEAGYGGRLFTLYAFDKGDNSYKELPDYKLVGESSSCGKTFVADFPTDVQYDVNDSNQEAEYLELNEYLFTISDDGTGPLKIK